MTTRYHTPLPFNGPVDTAPVNTRFGDLDAAIPYKTVVDVRDYGSVIDAGSINDAVDDVPAEGGIVWVPAGIHEIDATIEALDKPNVTIRGAGASHSSIFDESAESGTAFLWVGAAGGTVMHVGATTAYQYEHPVTGVRVEGVAIEGDGVAATGLLFTSVWWGGIRDLHVRNCTTVAVDIRGVDGLTSYATVQGCVFEQISVKQSSGDAPDGIGLRCGSATLAHSSVSLSTFLNVDINTHDGVGIQLNDTDGVAFYMAFTGNAGGGGTGYGVEFNAGANSTDHGNSRSNAFFFLQPANASGIIARGTATNTVASANNAIWYYSLENGGALPTIEAGASLVTYDRMGNRYSSGPSILSGSGSPEGAVTAVIGSLFLRTNGSTSTSLYVKTSGTGNTGWTAK